MKTKTSEMLKVAEKIKQSIEQIIFSANINDLGEARVAASLLLTVVEQFGAVLHLLNNEYSSHSPIIVRSMLEGLANLINLCNDRNYLNQLRFDNEKNNELTFKQYAEDPLMKDDPQAIAKLNNWKNIETPIKEELVRKGFKKQDVIDKFRLAGIQSTYIAYRVFCSFTHNQLITLMARHADEEQLNYLKGAPEALKQSILNVALSILCQAINLLPKFSDFDSNDLRKQIDEVDLLWALVAN